MNPSAKLIALLVTLLLGIRLSAQQPTTFQYFYDDLGQLSKVIDSTGNELDYTYDSLGNILKITRSQAPAATSLAILDFTPQSASARTLITIEGQNFNHTPSSDSVKFNGVTATVLSATANTLRVAVPSAATTGPISVTVASQTAQSSTNFTFIPTPAVLSVSPKSLLSSATALNIPNFQILGAKLTGAAFSFAPAFANPVVLVNSASIAQDGNSAVLNITVAPGAVGAFTLVATNRGGNSSLVAAASNTLNILNPNGDADADGLTNAVEVAIGTDPLNPETSGAGLPDGWQVFYGINPLDKTVAAKDFDNSGLTVLQDYQIGLSPRNPSRAAPKVSQINPRNGATGAFINTLIVARFNEPLLTGTSLTAAQNAIAAALGANSTVSASSQQIAATTLQAYMNGTCCGNSVIAGTVLLSGPAGAVAGSVTPSADGFEATFSPSQLLQSNTKYTVQVRGVKDAAGNLMTAAFSSSFTTGSSLDQTAPSIISTNPVNGAGNVPANASVTVTFNKSVDPSSVASGGFSMIDTTASLPVSGVIGLDTTYTIATFVPSAPLPMGHSFSVALTSAIKDLTGNSLLGNFGFGFTTGPLSKEADGLTFSLLNSSNPVVTQTRREADSLTFSLLNGKPATIPPGRMEVDSPTFSLLNGEAPPVGPTKYEADSLTFSLHNLAPSNSIQAKAHSQKAGAHVALAKP